MGAYQQWVPACKSQLQTKKLVHHFKSILIIINPCHLSMSGQTSLIWGPVFSAHGLSKLRWNWLVTPTMMCPPVSFCAKCSGFCVLTFLNRSQLFSQQSLAFELLQILHHCDADLRLRRLAFRTAVHLVCPCFSIHNLTRHTHSAF